MLNFFDFECFKYDWLVVIINPIERAEHVIINDPEKLKRYYEEHKNEIWVGYNSRGYDQFILKAILLLIDSVGNVLCMRKDCVPIRLLKFVVWLLLNR